MRNTILWCVLCAAAGFLLRPLFDPSPARAQTPSHRELHLEPGTFAMPTPDGGSTMGKVVVDLQTGEVWGFPTQGKLPYPGYQLSENKPQLSSPVRLGRFQFERLGSRRP